MVQDAISQDLSELPDASFAPIGEETLDQLADLPPIPTAGGRRTSRAPSLGPLTSPRKASRAPSLGPLTSPRKGSRPPSRRGSRAPSVQPSVAAVAETNGALDPSSTLAPNYGYASRRSSRAPSLGPTMTTVVTEEVTETTIVGASSSVPEGEGDSSLFLGPPGGLYPDLTQTGYDDIF